MMPSKGVIKAAGPKRVIVFAPHLLPYSETFISEQVRAIRHWQPVLVGERQTPNGLSLEGLDVRLLCHPDEGHLHRWIYTAYRLLGLPHPPSVQHLLGIGGSLLHAHFGTCAVDVWPMARVLGLPFVVTLHGYDINIHQDWWEAGHGGWRRRRYPRQLLRLARAPNVHFIAVSKAIRDRAIDYGIPADKLSVRYIGVDTDKFRPGGRPIEQRRKRILFVGRLVEKKGAAHLIRAFAKVRGHIPETQLAIVGDGPLRTELELLASDLHTPVEFLGVLSSEQVRYQMDQASVFCLPSVTTANGDAEGFGMVILEAQACGVPVLTSALGGATEGIADGRTGFKFREADHEALAIKLLQLLTDVSILTHFSSEAVEFVKSHFSLRKLTLDIEATYDKQVYSQQSRQARSTTNK